MNWSVMVSLPGEPLVRCCADPAPRPAMVSSAIPTAAGRAATATTFQTPCHAGWAVFAVPITIGVAGYADGSRSVPKQWGDRGRLV